MKEHMRRRAQRRRVRMPGLFSRLLGAVCGRTQRLITAGPSLPLVLATYPRQNSWLAAELSNSLRFTFPALTNEVKQGYRDALSRAPSVIVAELRLANVCSCLGHHHPEVNHSQLTKSLQADTGGESIALHHHNLHDAIRNGAPLKCDIDLGFNSSLACLIAVESFRTRKYLAWDPVDERVVEAA